MYELRLSRTNCDYIPKGWKWASGGMGERKETCLLDMEGNGREKNSCENFPFFTAA